MKREMKREKRVWISLILVFILMLVLSGCSGVTGPKTAMLNISIDPNPVPCSSEDGKWHITMTISESNGVGVTLTSVRFDSYDQTDQLYHTQFLYEEDIIDWFESNYIPAFSMLQSGIVASSTGKYDIGTIEGVDDNNTPVEATTRIDWLPQ
jgi:hypothetical protein